MSEKTSETPVDDTQEECVSEIIVNAVKLKPELWDMKNKFYKNMEYKKIKWAEICYELNLEDVFVETRWRSIRDRYLKEKKKTVPKSGQAANTKQPWYLMSSLTFLSDTVESRKTTTNIQRVSTTSSCSGSGSQPLQPKILAIGTDEETVIIQDQDLENLPLDIIADTSGGSSPPGDSNSQPIPRFKGNRDATATMQQNKKPLSPPILPESRPTSAQSSSRTPKRTRNSSPAPIEVAILEMVKSKEETNTANKDTFTPDEHFYLSIARDVAHFKLSKRLKIRQAVLDTVVRATDDNE